MAANVLYLRGSAKKTHAAFAERKAREIFQTVSDVIGDGDDIATKMWVVVLVNRENGRTAALDFFREQSEAEASVAVYRDAISNMNAPFSWFLKISKIRVSVK
jgi:hypothetical protein